MTCDKACVWAPWCDDEITEHEDCKYFRGIRHCFDYRFESDNCLKRAFRVVRLLLNIGFEQCRDASGYSLYHFEKFDDNLSVTCPDISETSIITCYCHCGNYEVRSLLRSIPDGTDELRKSLMLWLTNIYDATCSCHGDLLTTRRTPGEMSCASCGKTYEPSCMCSSCHTATCQTCGKLLDIAIRCARCTEKEEYDHR